MAQSDDRTCMMTQSKQYSAMTDSLSLLCGQALVTTLT